MPSALRYDNFELLPSVKTPEGYLLCEGTVAAAGVLEYLRHDGSTRRELVLPETLNNIETLGSLAFKPLTDEHPDEPVTAENVDQLGVGKVMDVAYEPAGGFIRVKMMVDRADTVRKVEADDGSRGLSPGYNVEIDETPGVHPRFGRYDAIQTRRTNNHVAITKAPRAGMGAASFRVDSIPEGVGVMVRRCDETRSDGREEEEEDAPSTDRGVRTMPQITIDGVTYEVADAAAAQAIAGTLKNRVDMADDFEAKMAALEEIVTGLKAQIAEKDEQMDAIKGERDGLQAKLDQLSSSISGPAADGEDGEDGGDETGETQNDSIEDRVKWFEERVELLAFAERLDVADVYAKTNEALRREIVSSSLGDRFDSESGDGYIRAAFDVLKLREADRTDSYTQASSALAAPKAGGEAKAADEYKNRLMGRA